MNGIKTAQELIDYLRTLDPQRHVRVAGPDLGMYPISPTEVAGNLVTLDPAMEG